MPPKRKIDLPDHVRAALLADLEVTHQQALDANERDKIRIYLGVEQGLTTEEIASQLGISQTSASKYRIQGEEAYRRRESARDQSAGEDPYRSAERAAVG